MRIYFQILVPLVESYNLKCPSPAHWKFRAKVQCNSTLKYFCLYNIVERRYVEGCNGPDWDRRGSKRIYAGDFSRGYCLQDRFQPFRFWTNGSMSDCIFAKSICSEEGQLIYEDDSTKDDRACRCDHKKNYAFTKTPRNLCYCIPSEEDCSCYVRSCPINQTLSADYSCIQRGLEEIFIHQCQDIKEYNKTVDEKTRRCMENNQLCYRKPISSSEWKDRATSAILVCIFIMHTIVGCFYVVFLNVTTIRRLQMLKIYIQKKSRGLIEGPFDMETVGASHEICEPISDYAEQKNEHFRVEKEQSNVEVHDTSKRRNECKGCTWKFRKIGVVCLFRLRQDEVNYLRLIHLLFRVACPVVRMIFDYEIKPNQLRSTLDKNKRKLEKNYRGKEKVLSDYQWNLLFRNLKEKTVTSKDFGIRLMICLLRIIANVDVGDLYPVQSDTSIGAMLSRIKFIRNEVTQSLEGHISEDQFNQYWDDIGQAVLKFMSSLENCQCDKGLTDRLLMLTSINVDTRDVCLFIDMSEKLLDVILQKIISEYCTFKGETIEDILRHEKHDLYHKRIKTESCCKCSTKQVSAFNKYIPEKHWKAIYEINMSNNSHSCPFHLSKCSESFVPKKTSTIDSSVIITLLLYSYNMMHFIASRLFVKGFCQFLLDNQHTLYHSIDNKRCCKCNTVPTEKILINKGEWNMLFIKATAIPCKIGTKDCCCQYSVRKEIEYSDVDESILFKLFYISSPFCVLNKIKKDAFLYFINWTLDVDPLRRALTELLEIVEDETFRSDMLQRILSDETESRYDDAYKWVSKHLRKQKATAKPPLQILVKDGDCLHVRSVQIPQDFNLPDRSRQFTDITSEENNFLVVVHALSKIVYHVVIHEFNTRCRHHILNAIRRDIFEQHCISPQYHDYDPTVRKKRMYLSQKQRDHLYSPQSKQSSISDLKLMIYILREKTNVEEKKDYIKQLDGIDEIRREIVQSSSGILNDERFKDIMERICEAVLYLGGERYMEELSSLQRIQNILGSEI